MPDVSLKSRITGFARAQGVDIVGIAPVESYAGYLAEVEHRVSETGATQADYMIAPEDSCFFQRLSDARNTLPGARSIVILGVYAYDDTADYRYTRRELRGKIARTYRYYPVVRQVAESVATLIQDQGFRATFGQDIPLKHVADRIGLGCYGKNGILLTKEFGSYIGLRDVLTDAPLEPDGFPNESLCGDCDLCLRACPTGALYAPYKVNPRLCLNPVTRSEGPIVPDTRVRMQNWIIGCDICQEVCPVNRGLATRPYDSRAGFDPEHHASHRLLGGVASVPKLLDLLGAEYPRVIRRNAAIGLGNVARGRVEAIEDLTRLAPAAGPYLEPYFRWALERVSEPAAGR